MTAHSDSSLMDVLRLKVTFHPDTAKLEYVLHSDSGSFRFIMASIGSCQLQSDLGGYFEVFCSHLSLEALAISAINHRSASRLAFLLKGQKLFDDLLPPELQKALWELRNKGLALQITSNETLIPWPIIALQSPTGVLPAEDGPFLCEAFALTQWVEGGRRHLAFPLSRIAHLAVDFDLPKVRQETEFMYGLRGEDRTVIDIDPTYERWCQALAHGNFDAFHFSGHSQFDEKGPAQGPAIELEDGQCLTPGIIQGSHRQFAKDRPLVFFNSCFSGRAARDLTEDTSWPKALIKNGAGAVLGTLLPVEDHAALAFAKGFYKAFLSGDCFGMAVQKARLKVKALGSPSWLAFVAYGDPNAKVSKVEAPSKIQSPSIAINPSLPETLADRLLEWQGHPRFPDRATSGYEAYFTFFWDLRHGQLSAKDRDRVLRVLAVLGQAKEPITASMLAAFSKRPLIEVTRILESWRPFLEVEDASTRDGHPTNAFSFFHPLLASLVKEKARARFGNRFEWRTHRQIVSALNKLQSAS